MSKFRRTHGHILLSHLRLSQPGGPGPRIYIPQEQGGPVIPRALGSCFVASYDLQGSGWRWSSSCDRQSIDQFVWVSGLTLGPLTRFYLALLSSSDNYFILLYKACSLTRKRVCSLQCNHSLVPITIYYRLIWDWVSILSPLTTRRDYGGGIITRLHTGQGSGRISTLTLYVTTCPLPGVEAVRIPPP
jgi:hypothetical protein